MLSGPHTVTQFWSVNIPVREFVGVATNLLLTGSKLCHPVLMSTCCCFLHVAFNPVVEDRTLTTYSATIAMTKPLCFLHIRPECFLHLFKQDQET